MFDEGQLWAERMKKQKKAKEQKKAKGGNMSDYISREDILKAIDDNHYLDTSSKVLFSHIVNQVPAANVIRETTTDGVPIVRCKDCVYAKIPNRFYPDLWCDCHYRSVDFSDFCNYGARKDE